MGMFDNLRKQADKALDQHGDKITKGIDKAAGMASQKVGGKHADKITKGAAAAKGALNRRNQHDAGVQDDDPTTPPAPPTPPTPPSSPGS